MEDQNKDRNCPICGCSQFLDFRGRQEVLCAECRSLPRTRSTFLLIKKFARPDKNSRIAHFAPEPGLAKKLFQMCGEGYEVYDFHPGRYQDQMSFTKIRKCDLCHDIEKFDAGSYDVVLHNHVLEHLPCSYVMVLLKLQNLLKPGGVQVFSVPISPGHTASNFSPDLSEDERKRSYGQSDHLVRFGALDHDQHLGMVFGHASESYTLDRILEESELLRANIPRRNWIAAGSTVFAAVKA